VAGGATRCDARVVEAGAQKAGKALMATLARGGCRDVIGGLTEGERAVVARRAAGADAGMVHRRAWTECDSARMAEFARLGGRNVVGWLAECGRSIVAGGATRCDARVVEAGAQKAGKALVAALARRGCRDVIGGLT